MKLRSERLLPIDAVRGTAMVFVGISHISLYVAACSHGLAQLLRWAGMFATPNFLLMSGCACGYQLARAGSREAVARIVDRGLFVLLVGHVLIAGSLVYVSPPGKAFEYIVITDTIGFLLLTAPLIRTLTPMQALVGGASVFLLSSLVSQTWQPASNAGILFGELMLDMHSAADPGATWLSPTIQYFGLFVLGSGIGKLIFTSADRRGTYRGLLLAGGLAIVAAFVLNGGMHFLKPHLADSTLKNLLLASTDIRRKNPPGLAYALFYGGAGVTLVGMLGYLASESLIVRAARVPAVFGRSSFVTYVSQQWLIDFVPIWIGLETWLTPPAAVTYLVLVVIVTFGIAYAWDVYQGNRWLTLGLKKIPLSAPLPSPVLRRGVIAFATCVSLAVAVEAGAMMEAPALIPPKLGLLTSRPERWEPDIRKLEAADAQAPRDGAVFVGSSSIRFWDVPRWFPELAGRTLNHGFGGSYLSDSVYFLDRLVLPHAPRVVVIYAGDNDIDAGVSADHVARSFAEIDERVHAALPDTRIVFISIKPGLTRARNARTIDRANAEIQAYCASHAGLTYLDVAQSMRGPDGAPRRELYQPDGIHLTDAGYELWSNALRPVLDEALR